MLLRPLEKRWCCGCLESYFSCANIQLFHFNMALGAGKLTKFCKGIRKKKTTFSVSMAGIQHKIPTSLEGFIPYYPYVISETLGDGTLWKTCNVFLIFPTSFGWTSLEIKDNSDKLELPHICNTGVG